MPVARSRVEDDRAWLLTGLVVALTIAALPSSHAVAWVQRNVTGHIPAAVSRPDVTGANTMVRRLAGRGA